MSFTWQSTGHAFASLLKDVFTVSKKVEVALTEVQQEAPVIEALTGLVSPNAAMVEQIAFGALGMLVGAVHDTGTAVSANGINIQFDATVVGEIKQLIVAFPEIVHQVEAAFPTKAAKA